LLSGPAGGTTALAAGDATGTTGTIGAGEATAGAIGVPSPLSWSVDRLFFAGLWRLT
jgi:hypothetical protein